MNKCETNYQKSREFSAGWWEVGEASSHDWEEQVPGLSLLETKSYQTTLASHSVASYVLI